MKMAEVKMLSSGKHWLTRSHFFVVRLSNEDIEAIDAAGSPVKTIISLIPFPDPGSATALALFISGYMHFIRKQNKNDGYRGVVLDFRANWYGLPAIVKSIDTW
jgi:C-terminal processing protease CtpA/Prc